MQAEVMMAAARSSEAAEATAKELRGEHDAEVKKLHRMHQAATSDLALALAASRMEHEEVLAAEQQRTKRQAKRLEEESYQRMR